MNVDFDTLDRLVKTRRSVRSFEDRAVPEALLEQVLEAARWAPSAGNRQQLRLLVVTSRQVIDDMAEAVGRVVRGLREAGRQDVQDTLDAYLDNFTFFRHAPCLIVPIYRVGPDLLAASAPGAQTARRAPEVDTLSSAAAAVMVLLLAAHGLGLGGCWMTGPLVAADRLRDVLEVPVGWGMAAVVPLGFPKDVSEPPGRRALSRLVRRIS
ncbi:MAG: nitroreductase family protein [bacterium]